MILKRIESYLSGAKIESEAMGRFRFLKSKLTDFINAGKRSYSRGGGRR